jgi:hypothetical protein
MAAHVETLAAEVRQAKAAAAAALAEKAALGAELLEQARLQRRAKASRLKDQEKVRAWGVGGSVWGRARGEGCVGGGRALVHACVTRVRA